MVAVAGTRRLRDLLGAYEQLQNEIIKKLPNLDLDPPFNQVKNDFLTVSTVAVGTVLCISNQVRAWHGQPLASGAILPCSGPEALGFLKFYHL